MQFTFSSELLVSRFEIRTIQTFRICEQMLLVGLPCVPVIFLPRRMCAHRRVVGTQPCPRRLDPASGAGRWAAPIQPKGRNLWLVIIALRQTPVISGHPLHVRNFGVEVSLKIHEMHPLVCLNSYWNREFHFQVLFCTSEQFLKVTPITDTFGVNQNCVPGGVTSSCIGGKLM